MDAGSGRLRRNGVPLVDLHHLLIERGFRRSSRNDSKIVLEEQDEEPADTGAAANGPASRQKRSIPPGFGGMSFSERRTAIARLASVLLEAAGVAMGERGDDER
jgi:hypothetical protein